MRYIRRKFNRTMKEKLGLYHFTAIAIVAVWGLTYISTKVLMQNGLLW